MAVVCNPRNPLLVLISGTVGTNRYPLTGYYYSAFVASLPVLFVLPNEMIARAFHTFLETFVAVKNTVAQVFFKYFAAKYSHATMPERVTFD